MDAKRRPLSRSIDEHLFAWREHAWPIDWPSVFGRDAELVLEIGFGNGDFLVDQARRHPERDHVGLELSWSGAFRLLKRARPEQTNLRAMLVDAEAALAFLFRPASLSQVFVNHPCPWPKERHHARRLLHTPMLALLADRMRVGARLTVVSDHAEYAAFVAETLAAQDTLASLHDGIEVDSIPGRRTTKYERKAMAAGTRVHYFEWAKAREAPPLAPPPDLPLAADEDMPSVKLSGLRTDPFTPFEPLVWRERHEDVEVVVRASDVWRRVSSSAEEERASPATWLIQVMVQEDRLRQDFMVVATRRAPDELLLKLGDLGSPHPTHGVRRALYALAARVLERHPGTRVRHENLGPDAMAPPASAEARRRGSD